MNDDRFLYQLREEPDPLFVDRLRRRIQPETVPPTFKASRVHNRKWVAAAISVSIFFFGLLFTYSPTARALLQTATTEIAGRMFTVSDAYPYENQEDAITVEPKILTVKQALAQSHYPIHLPTYIPAGYHPREDTVLAYPPLNDELGPVLYFSWEGKMDRISLMVCSRCPWERGELIAPGTAEEVTLANGRPAVLVRGGWYLNERQWRTDIVITLEWTREGVLYQLSAPGDFPVEELITMASSTWKE